MIAQLVWDVKGGWTGNLARSRTKQTTEECRGKRLRTKDRPRNSTEEPGRVMTGTKGQLLLVKALT